MIVLDTTVVSEAMRGGNRTVLEWLDRQIAETLYLTATSLSELLLGIERLPNGRRRNGLNTALIEALAMLFPSRVLPFDAKAAEAYAPLVAQARATGGAISAADGQVAAIAVAHGFSVATRDVTPFEAVGVPVINPWIAI